ncbi:GTP-binding protein [Methanopyrus sp.]
MILGANRTEASAERLEGGDVNVVNVVVCGHFNHGKTTLVKALTGEWLDKLPHEREMGVTIEPARAFLEFRDTTISFVDVPGHRDYIRNMLASAWSADYAILVVAADEGPCPGTIDHALVISFYGARVLPVVNKVDLVDRNRVSEVADEVMDLLELLGVETVREPVLVSAKTGEGAEELLDVLAELEEPPRPSESDSLRAPVESTRRVGETTVDVFGVVDRGTLEEGWVEVQPGGLNAEVLEVESAGGFRPGSPFKARLKVEGSITRGMCLGEGLSTSDGIRAEVLSIGAKVRPGTMGKVHVLSAAANVEFVEVETHAGTEVIRPYAEGHNVAHVVLELDREVVVEPGDRFLVTVGDEPAVLGVVEGAAR